MMLNTSSTLFQLKIFALSMLTRLLLTMRAVSLLSRSHSLSDEQKIKEVEEGIREVDDAARDQMITRVVDRRLGRQEAGVPMGPPTSAVQ
jgi:hypothetical protein